MIESRGDNGMTYRPEFTFRFWVNRRTVEVTGYDGWTMTTSGYDVKRAVLDSFHVGQEYPVW